MAENKRENGTTSSIHGISTQLKKMRLKDWEGLFFIAAAFIPGKIWKVLHNNIWVISEYENLARDNGYWFFKYVRENHGEIEAYYPISDKSPDYEKIAKIGNMVAFESFKHYCLFWAANKYIGTTKCFGFPYRRICEDLVQWNLHGFKYIFLNHGFTRGYSSIVDASETNYDMVITCGEQDSKVIIEDNGQPDYKVKCLGYARHDSLNDDILDRKQILIMPTWRRWLNNPLTANPNEADQNERLFLESEYYKKYNELINNRELINFLEDKGLHLVFYLHEYAQTYSHLFNSVSDRIIVGTNENYDIQQLLKQSVVLITDYSSVCYDFSYMHKPVVYYQFDHDEFEEKQYASGNNFSYETNGFGKQIFDEHNVIEEIKQLYMNDFRMPSLYVERADAFFKYHDRNNCKRIFNAIIKMD